MPDDDVEYVPPPVPGGSWYDPDGFAAIDKRTDDRWAEAKARAKALQKSKAVIPPQTPISVPVEPSVPLAPISVPGATSKKKKQTVRRRVYLSKLMEENPNQAKIGFSYYYPDLANLFGVSHDTIRHWATSGKLDPYEMESICRLWMERQLAKFPE